MSGKTISLDKSEKIKIIILMENGVIQDIENIPENIEVTVKDKKPGWVQTRTYTKA